MLSPVGFQSHPVQFGRAFTPEELEQNREVLDKAKQALGGYQGQSKRLGVILPVRSLPAASVNPEADPLGMGNEYGGLGAMQFLHQIGFDELQSDPAGQTGRKVSSPYMGRLFWANPLQIDLPDLTTERWGQLLTSEQLGHIAQPVPRAHPWTPTVVNYEHAYNITQGAVDEPWWTGQRPLQQAYLKFVEKGPIAAQDSALKSRYETFLAFKAAHSKPLANQESFSDITPLQRNALFEYLVQAVYKGQDDWTQWQGEFSNVDKNIFKQANPTAAVNERLSKLEKSKNYQTYFDYLLFTQFVAQEQKSTTINALNGKLGLMGDLQVGMSNADTWANQDILLDGWALGVGPDYFSSEGQAWGFAVVDPAKIYDPVTKQVNPNAPGSKFYKALFLRMFQNNPGGLRIDHTIGLIDPWVYPMGKSPKEGTRLFSSPEHKDLGQYARIAPEQLNDDKPPMDNERVKSEALEEQTIFERYASFINNIVLAAAHEANVPKERIIFEDLGTVTNPVKAVMEKLGLRGIRVNEFSDFKQPASNDPQDETGNPHNATQVQAQHFYAVGTHDNPALRQWFIGMMNERKRNENGQPTNQKVWPTKRIFAQAVLAKLHLYLLDSDSSLGLNLPTSLKTSGLSILNLFDSAQKKSYRLAALANAMAAETIASKAGTVHLMFSDWLGMDKTYNKPGTVNEDEFLPGITADKRLKTDGENWRLRMPSNYQTAYYQAVEKGRALNLPALFAKAMLSRGNDFARQHMDTIKQLVGLANILYEPSEPVTQPESSRQGLR